MKIVLGSDHGGYKLKKQLIAFLRKEGHSVKDVGTFNEQSCDYPDYVYKAAKTVAAKDKAVGREAKKLGT